jgi:O-antigen ligase
MGPLLFASGFPPSMDLEHKNTSRAIGLGWALLPCFVALPWLLETHTEPWTKFYADWLISGIVLSLLVWVLTRSPAGLPATPLLLGVAALGAVPLLQAAVGVVAFPTDSALAALYLAGFALAILASCRSEGLAPGRAADALFTGLAIAAIASVGLQLYQWLDLSWFGSLVRELPPYGRPFANVGQPNLLATLEVWGVVALWWAYERKAIGPMGAFTGAAFLLLGVAMTQSRAGWVELGLIVSVAFIQLPAMKRHVPRAVVVTLVAGFALFVLCWPMLGSELGRSSALALADQVAAGKRPAIWRLALDAIAARPWFGWGWGQGGDAHVALAASHTSIQIQITHMHNLVLDLLLWNGIPVGMLAVVAFAAWYVRRWRAEGTATQRLMLLALGVLIVHSMLELPYAYALFLLPAGLMIGVVEAQSRARTVLVIPRWAVASAAGLSLVALVMLFAEKVAVEQDMMALRMRAARIANLPPLGPPPRLVWMAPYGELLANLRTEPVAGMDAASLERFRRVAYHFPATGNLLRLAEADALNGRSAEAKEALALLCDLRPNSECTLAGRFWNDVIRPRYPALSDTWPAAVLASDKRQTASDGTSR